MSEQKKKKLPYFSDVVLFKRVDKYLDDNVDKRMIDKEEMVEELRTTYKEYLRRNKSAFRLAVFKAYNMINQNILEVTQERSQDGSDIEAIDDQSQDSVTTERDIQPTPAAVNMMQTYLQGLNAMTSPSVVQRAPKSSSNELINISSDEGEEEQPPAKKVAQLAHTSQRDSNRSRHHQQNDHLHYQHPRQEYGNPRTQAAHLITNAIPDLDVSKHHHPHQNHNSKDEEQRRKKAKSRSAYPAVSIFPTQKKRLPAIPDAIPDVKYRDFGGYPKVLQTVSDLVLHFYQSTIYSQLGVTPPRGFLLHGPPGCGKTLLAHAVAGELNLPLVKASGPELIGGISGESEERIRKVFMLAKQQVPCILFIDEIDVISQIRESARKDMERRVVSQLIVCLDDLNSCDEGEDMIVIGATNRVEELDPGLRRAGRFDKEVCIGIPDREARVGILQVLCRPLKLSPDVSIAKIAELTPGFVAADLKSLISDAAVAAVKRIFQQRLEKTSQPKPTVVNQVPIRIADDEGEDNAMAVDVKDDRGSSANAVDSQEEPKNGGGIKDGDEGEGGPKSAPSVTKDAEERNGGESVQGSDQADVESAQPSAEGAVEKETEVENPTETSDKPEATSAMEVDDDPPKVQPSPEEAAVVGSEIVVENGVAEDQKSESEDACVIVEDDKKPKDPDTNIRQSVLNLSRAGETVVQIEMRDLMAAIKITQPSAKREGFATVPDVTWDDIGSLKDVRNELTMSIMMPVKYPDEFKRMGIHAPSGILLWGPPGCGKTLLAKAIANESNINFISVKGPELLNMYVGESEKAVRTCFARARNSKPCVIFFDEIDALCPRRSDSSEGSVSSRVVNQVLTEMDGVEGRDGVFLMAASNRPDMVDPAVLRPGRLDKIVQVGLPKPNDRVDILRAITKNGTQPPLGACVDLEKIGTSAECEGYSGADLSALVKEASVLALTEHLTLREKQDPEKQEGELFVLNRHFQNALKKIKPSVHAEERLRYDMMTKLYSSS